MTNLRRMLPVVVLTLVLAIAGVAGEINSPPCAPPEPGQTETMPCGGGQSVSDNTTPGQLETPPASDSVDLVTVAEDAITTLLLFTIS
jgi:hypothetical protein